MIWFYSGTPGSGKSFHTAKDIRLKLRKGQDVISTVNIDINNVSITKGKKKLGKFIYKPITEVTPKYLYEYAFRNHKKGKEGQTLIILDECQIILTLESSNEQAAQIGSCFLQNTGISVIT